MGNQYTRYSIQVSSEEEKDIVVALLGEWGIEGFQEEQGLLLASGITDELNQNAIEAYLGESRLVFSTEVIEEQNWNTVWESNFEPVQVGDFVGVRAHFHPSFSGVLHEIVITPKMSFGTGHHATTFMMMAQMEQMPVKGASVFDFGTGTGILAILAEKMGATKILATDYDDWCIANGGENIMSNQCTNIELKKMDHPPLGGVFNIVLANINKNIILYYFKNLIDLMQPDGMLLLSGLLEDDEADILAIANAHQLVIKKKMVKNGWTSLLLGITC